MLNILAVGSRPNDVELGMGGSILKFNEAGYQVTIDDLTEGKTTPKGNNLETEKKKALNQAEY